MQLLRLAIVTSLVALFAATSTPARQQLLKNGSKELGGGAGAIDERIPDEWTMVGVNIERSPTVNLEPPGDGHALKAFGDGDNTSVSAFQEVPNISPGQSVQASVFLHTPAFDKLGGSGQAGLRLEFLNQFGGTIGGVQETYVLNAASPADTWIPASIGPLVAPANTVRVRVTCRLFWSLGNIVGAAYWDDAVLSVNGGPNLLLNGDFETAGPSPGQSAFGIDDWVGFNDQEKSSDVAEHGGYSLKLGTSAQYSGLFQNMGVLNAGDQVVLQAWVWNPASDPLVGNSRAGLKLEFSPNGEAPPPEENLAFDETTPMNVWTPVEMVTVVPEDVNLARIVMIYVADAGVTGSVHFDSAWAERSSQPGVNKLLNASFESGVGGEDGLTNWTEFFGGGAECRKACFVVPAHNGACTARARGPATAGLYQEIEVVPGESLTIRAQLYSASGDPLAGAAARAGVKVEWRLGTLPDVIDIGDPEQNNTILAGSAPTNQWIPLTIEYTMPAGANAIGRIVEIIEKGNALTGRVYFDSAEVVVLNRFDGIDGDGDNDQDLHDFANFQRCFSDSGGGLLWNCLVNDHDDDGDVDIDDWNYFWPRMTGPN